MPTWGELLSEIYKASPPDFDGVRRTYLVKLASLTGRDTILYATKWTQGGLIIDPSAISITAEDLQGLMEVTHGLKGPDLDLIIHSPGGSVEATEAMLTYLRSKFKHIRAVIPAMAMSAATMLACGCNEIVMGKHSFIGPIDPQIIVLTSNGPQAMPAQAIEDQFRQAQLECTDVAKLGSWLPILQQYGPALLAQCRNATDLSKQLVRQWLKQYMFAKHPDAAKRARRIANWLSRHKRFKSHSRYIPRDQAREKGLIVAGLEDDEQFQDLVLTIYHATTHTFNDTPAMKIIENHLGKAFIKLQATRLAASPAV